MPWFVYIVECRDGTLYTGCTNDVGRRVAAHNEGTGARYTRSRRPVVLRYLHRSRGRSAAMRREALIKRMPRKEKRRLLSEKEIQIP